MSEEAVSGFVPAGPLVVPSGVVRILSERIEELCEDIARLHAGACGCDENDDTMQVYCIAFKLGLADERGKWLTT